MLSPLSMHIILSFMKALVLSKFILKKIFQKHYQSVKQLGPRSGQKLQQSRKRVSKASSHLFNSQESDINCTLRAFSVV